MLPCVQSQGRKQEAEEDINERVWAETVQDAG